MIIPKDAQIIINLNQADGLVIARERIAEETRARTGFLDLGQLGLTELPEELFTLRHRGLFRCPRFVHI